LCGVGERRMTQGREIEDMEWLPSEEGRVDWAGF